MMTFDSKQVKKQVMKINNRKITSLLMYGLFCVLILDIASFIIIKKILDLDYWFLFGFLCLIFILAVWQFITLKVFSVEVSEHIISIKYNHPLGRKPNLPVLEVPLQKVISYKIEKGMINDFFMINIDASRGVKTFYYRLNLFTRDQQEGFHQVLNSIKPYSENEAQL